MELFDKPKNLQSDYRTRDLRNTRKRREKIKREISEASPNMTL